MHILDFLLKTFVDTRTGTKSVNLEQHTKDYLSLTKPDHIHIQASLQVHVYVDRYFSH